MRSTDRTGQLDLKSSNSFDTVTCHDSDCDVKKKKKEKEVTKHIMAINEGTLVRIDNGNKQQRETKSLYTRTP